MLSFFDALHEANASAAQPSSAAVKAGFAIPCAPVRRLCMTLTSRLRARWRNGKRESRGLALLPGRRVQALGAGGEDLAAGFGDADAVFELRRVRAVARH